MAEGSFFPIPPAPAAPPPPAAATPVRKKKTLEQVYQKKTQLEHILLRPDTYIGSVEKHSEKLWVWDEKGGETGDGEMALKDITFVPGLYKIFDEILVNAADNKKRDPKQSKIKVDINPEQGYIKVWNNGDGIPVQVHKEHGIYIPELIFGHLLTGSNYDDDEKKTTGGRNGYGAKLANIFSTKFVVETRSKACGKHFRKVWRDNMTKSEEAVVTSCSRSDEDFTSVAFWPDFAKFQMEGLDPDHVALLHKRVYDVAGNTPRDLKVYLNGRPLPVRDFEHYVDLFPGMGEDKKKDSYAAPNDRWQICVRPSNIDFQQVSFVNSIWTMKGGRHVQYIVDQVVEQVTEAVKKRNKKLEIKPHMVKQFLWVFVNASIENPAFDSQTKETLNTLKGKFGSKCEVPQKMIDVLCKVIAERVAARANDKLDRAMAAKVAGLRTGRLVGIPKLEDANDAGGKNSRYCTLILTEGDSAKALVLAGMSEIGCDRFGVFPLRGKLLNVREAPKKQILENKEVQALTRIIGLKVGTDYTSVDGLRYGCVMIMTDQDTDGSHIKGFLINFFHTFWPGLLRVPGFLVQFITPVVKAFAAGKRRVPTDGIPFYNIPDMLSFKAEQERSRKRYEYKYYKGLGSSDNSEAKQYFSQLTDHRIEFLYDQGADGEDDRHIKLAFARDQIENRKGWITAHSPDDAGVDFKTARRTGLTYRDFINKDLIWFSVADCERSIPNVLDGLKPAQRKALWSCFKRNLTREIRVSQLTGYVSEKACYHHGEVSMQGTIASMAQDFVGSNNLPLLVPCGMFGSRHVGGKDCASARYIHTKLAPVARVLFNKTDDYLINYKDDDGTPVEPEWYIPVLPTVLVNGCAGIGTGFATSILNYNPLDLLRNVRNLIAGNPQEPLVPWYRGHTREMKVLGNSRFLSLGKVEQIDSRVARISELPVKYWTEDCQKVLDEMQEKGFISCYRNHTTSESIDIDVGFNQEVLARITERPNGLYEVFGLAHTQSATNLVCFDRMGRLKKYESPEAILEGWYYVRLEHYGRRKCYMVEELQRTCEKLRNMVRFIREVNEGQLVVQKRKKRELLAELKQRGYKGFPPAQRLKLSKQSVDTEEKEEEEEDPSDKYFAEGSERKKGEGSEEEQELAAAYDYLLSMRIWSLTYERARQLEEQMRRAQEDPVKLQGTTEKEMWLDDLGSLEQSIRKANAEWQEALGKDPSRGGGDGALPAKGKCKKKVEKARQLALIDLDFEESDARWDIDQQRAEDLAGPHEVEGVGSGSFSELAEQLAAHAAVQQAAAREQRRLFDEQQKKEQVIERVQCGAPPHPLDHLYGEVSSSAGRLQVMVIYKKTITKDVDPQWTGAQLKEALRGAADGAPPHAFKVDFGTKVLDDARTLESYGLRAGDTLRIGIRGRGGAPGGTQPDKRTTAKPAKAPASAAVASRRSCSACSGASAASAPGGSTSAGRRSATPPSADVAEYQRRCKERACSHRQDKMAARGAVQPEAPSGEPQPTKGGGGAAPPQDDFLLAEGPPPPRAAATAKAEGEESGRGMADSEHPSAEDIRACFRQWCAQQTTQTLLEQLVRYKERATALEEEMGQFKHNQAVTNEEIASQFQRAHTVFQEELEQLRGTISRKDEELQDTQRERAALQRRLAEREAAHDAVAQRLGDTEAELAQQRLRAVELERKAAAADARADGEAAKAAAVDDRVAVAERRAREYEADRDQYVMIVDRGRRTEASLREQVNELLDWNGKLREVLLLGAQQPVQRPCGAGHRVPTVAAAAAAAAPAGEHAAGEHWISRGGASAAALLQEVVEWGAAAAEPQHGWASLLLTPEAVRSPQSPFTLHTPESLSSPSPGKPTPARRAAAAALPPLLTPPPGIAAGSPARFLARGPGVGPNSGARSPPAGPPSPVVTPPTDSPVASLPAVPGGPEMP